MSKSRLRKLLEAFSDVQPDEETPPRRRRRDGDEPPETPSADDEGREGRPHEGEPQS